LVRLLTTLPITAGGPGITESGLDGTLAASAGPDAGAQVTAVVLLYRAVTYLPPSLGAAYLVWQHTPGLRCLAGSRPLGLAGGWI